MARARIKRIERLADEQVSYVLAAGHDVSERFENRAIVEVVYAA
ncbi:hypothetical protein [Caballeronia terrestris]|nr:hypothetical protein [Caballeronia terrestris]